MLEKTFPCFLITTWSAFNQSIQLDSIKTGKQILSEFPVPCWECQLIPIGNRNRSRIGYHSKQSRLPAILKHMLEDQQLLWTVMSYSK